MTESGSPVAAHVVGNAFVSQYYLILHKSPGLVHRFYQDISSIGRPEENGSMSVTTTMEGIHDKIVSLMYDESRVEIKYVDSLASFDGGVSVLVTGCMTGKDEIPKSFSQSFFLAPQDNGFFVLSDIFRFTESASQQENANHQEERAPTQDVVAPATPEVVAPATPEVVAPATPEAVAPATPEAVAPATPEAVAPATPEAVAPATPEVVAPVTLEQAREIAPVVEKSIPEDAAVSTEESQVKEVVHVAKEEVTPVQEEAPVSKVVNEVQDSLQQLAVESNTIAEDQPKKSYASIVMKSKNNVVPSASPVPAPKKPQPKRQQQLPVNNAPTTVVAAEPIASSAASGQNGNHEEEAEGYSVYIKGLTVTVTQEMLEEEFKKFGAIKPNGIQIRSNRLQGFSFGFVEFEVPEAVQKAIEASPISIDGRNAVVEEKRSTMSRGGYRGRFVGGRGPGIIRNDNMRGRGNYGGGRGYNRGPEFDGNRNNYGYRSNSRGGSSNRGGGDGYERNNNGGGRVNRGADVNGNATRNTPQ